MPTLLTNPLGTVKEWYSFLRLWSRLKRAVRPWQTAWPVIGETDGLQYRLQRKILRRLRELECHARTHPSACELPDSFTAMSSSDPSFRLPAVDARVASDRPPLLQNPGPRNS